MRPQAPRGLRDRRLSSILKRCFSNFLPSPPPLRIPANQSLRRIFLFPFSSFISARDFPLEFAAEDLSMEGKKTSKKSLIQSGGGTARMTNETAGPRGLRDRRLSSILERCFSNFHPPPS
ncbi:hypothetical protein CEXT_30061 [Caerostris extrusa]|uniref:Uncharacterized protein n=1 Tax=Caerostris extrusa TaxID=172846 RepID=A0AAV4VT51_CAEEX|nr:hypothetical protein CEXT_30061 [Caerostris extrusa]